ncbi:MAG TPA: linear amide C-N hydrolase [Flavisolibacter sp.]|jgi:choloylglycine hydrolase|nr:linear amide C-N hydrolase [Flavisolibacter sp.]
MKKILLLLTLLPMLYSTQACTTFFINSKGELVFGRNYDWMTGNGMVCTNLRGLHKTSLPVGSGKTIDWNSRYGSITFNQYGKEFPTGGMNEKGLVVEVMWLEGSQYPKPDDRAALDVLQWIQYQLDNQSTVAEVIASDKKIRLAQENPPLHYLVADAKGHAAAIEFLSGQMVVHQQGELPYAVLTNTTYEESVKVAKKATSESRADVQDNSLERFTTACSMVQQVEAKGITKPLNDYAFDILNATAQKESTQWSIVYDLKHKSISFRTMSFRDIKTLAFEDFRFDCDGTPMVFDMNQPFKGPVDKFMIPFTASMNKKLIEKSVKESQSQVPISDEEKQALIAYPASIRCR